MRVVTSLQGTTTSKHCLLESMSSKHVWVIQSYRARTDWSFCSLRSTSAGDRARLLSDSTSCSLAASLF